VGLKTEASKMSGGKPYTFLSFALICLTLLGNFSFSTEVKPANVSLESGIPIKWAVIVMGGYNYYRDLTYNAIQRIEKIMLGRGVPYDLFEDDEIVAPTDTAPTGKHPLQFADGSLQYQTLVLLCDYEQSDTTGVNQIYIDWAVANGTNAVLFHRVAQFVPELLGITANDVGWIWQHKKVSCIVNKTFNDGIKEYVAGSNITMTSSLQWHALIHKYHGMTLWFNRTWDSDWSLGMANTTCGNGKVWYLGWSWNDAYRMEDATAKYINDWSKSNFDFWGHAINFCFNNAEEIALKILPYKKWKGAWITRFDTDHYRWEDYWLPPESVLKSGWTWDYEFCVLGYGRAGGVHPIPLTDGAPDGYSGVPSSKVMHAYVTGVLQTDLINNKDYKAIIYNNTVGSNYDRIKIDFNKNMNFADDTEYKLWENMTYPTVQGKLYWYSITPDATQPEEINIAWWQTPMIFASDTTKDKFKQYGHEYGLYYGFHGWQHNYMPVCEGAYGMWNGTCFLNNATFIEQHFNASRYWMSYGFEPTGYGFEENAVIISHPNDCHPYPVDFVIANLSWVLFSYAGQSDVYWIGFAKNSAMDKYWLASSRTESFYTPSNFTIIQEMVQTLYPVISTYSHALNGEIFNSCKSFYFPPYSNSIKPANPIEAFQFWLNSKYMLEHTANAYYKNGKIVLEFTANSTLKDYVWKFPLEYEGKYFNGFSDNKNIGKIKHFDGEYVYLEFSQGQGAQRLEATYGSNPHIHEFSSYTENVTQTYTAKNLTLQLWNASGSVNVKVDCTRLGRPDSVKTNGVVIEWNYNSSANICQFNVTFNPIEIVQLLWTHAPPNPTTLVSPQATKRFDPSTFVTFTWNFSDPDLDDSQSAYRLQLDNDKDFTSPIIDTEKVTSDRTHITRMLPNIVGLYYWRVKAWDTQNAEGDWSVGQTIIVDRFKITLKGVTDSRTDVGASVCVYFNVTREYDSILFEGTKGTVYINGSTATWDEANKYWKLNVTQTSVGSFMYQVSNIVDMEDGITAINNPVGRQQVIWDNVIITITPDATNVTIGNQVSFKVIAVYAYDNEQVSAFTIQISRDGEHFGTNNFTDTCTVASTHEYTTERVKETTYGLNAFTSNSPSVTWIEKTLIQLLVDWLTSNILIVISIVGLIMFVFLLIRKQAPAHTQTAQ
jgi:hypothetical protein